MQSDGQTLREGRGGGERRVRRGGRKGRGGGRRVRRGERKKGREKEGEKD